MSSIPAVASWSSASIVPGANLTLSKPECVLPGNLLLLLVGNDADVSNVQFSASFVEGGRTWTRVATTGSTTADCYVGAYWRVADGTEEATVVVPAQGSFDFWGYYLCVTTSATASPVPTNSAPQLTSSAASHVINAITTSITNSLAFYVLAFDGGDGNPFGITGAGWTEVSEIEAGTGSGNAGGVWGTKSMAATGSTGTATISSNTSDGSARFMFAVSPGPARFLMSDSSDVTDSPDRVLTKYVWSLDEVAVADSELTNLVALRKFLDSASLADFVYAIKVIGGEAYVEYLVDSLGLSESVVYAAILARLLQDSVGSSDAIQLTKTAQRPLSESIASVDALSRAWLTRRYASDSTSLSEQVNTISAFLRKVDDSIATTEATLRLLNILRRLSDSTAFGELGILAGFLLSRWTSDSIGIGESIGAPIIALGRLLADAVAVAHAETRVATLGRRTSDSIAPSDALARLVSYPRLLSDSVTSADALSFTRIMLRYLLESAAVSDVAARSVTLSRSLSDALAAAESILAARALIALLADIISTQEEASATYIIGTALKLFERLTYLRRSIEGKES